jgi:hypothetical protein
MKPLVGAIHELPLLESATPLSNTDEWKISTDRMELPISCKPSQNQEHSIPIYGN